MLFISDAQRARLLANGQRRAHDPAFDPVPVLKVYTPDARVVWLLAFLYPEDPGRVHALCDAGTGFPGLADIRMDELERLRGPRGVALAIDRSFVPVRTLKGYARRAVARGAYADD